MLQSRWLQRSTHPDLIHPQASTRSNSTHSTTMTDGSDTLQRFPELWFDDGNIVFQVGDVQFRLHRGVLASRSSVFKDMLLVRAVNKDEDMVDGCIVIQLHIDAGAAKTFFNAIYYPSSFDPPPGRVPALAILIIAYLSSHYKVRDLRSRALSHLELAFPTTLEAYDGSNCGTLDGLTGFPVYDILTVSKSCVFMDAPWLLPSFYYFLCRQHSLITSIG
ncbi:hypothetical protein B0H34DRAFT_96718, partial [Crassisporium funariophilum]